MTTPSRTSDTLYGKKIFLQESTHHPLKQIPKKKLVLGKTFSYISIFNLDCEFLHLNVGNFLPYMYNKNILRDNKYYIYMDNCSAWPKSKLNTKIGLHTTHHHLPPLPPPPQKLFSQKGLSQGYEIKKYKIYN